MIFNRWTKVYAPGPPG